MFTLRRASFTAVNPRILRVASTVPARGLAGTESYNEDHIVPDFYVSRKASKGDPSALMQTAAGLSASTRRLESKVPTEVFDKDGTLIHPSGFVIPTPGEPSALKRAHYDESGLSTQTAAVAERVNEEASLADLNTSMRHTRHKIPFEVQSVDGVVVHPSGFVPPTAAHEFKLNHEYGSTSPGSDYRSVSDAQGGSRSMETDPATPQEKAEQHKQLEQSKPSNAKSDSAPPLMPNLANQLASGSVEASTTPRDEKMQSHDQQKARLPSGFDARS
jgi:hypothetical protein